MHPIVTVTQMAKTKLYFLRSVTMQAMKVLGSHNLGLGLVDAQHREPIDPTMLVLEIFKPHLLLFSCLTPQPLDLSVNAKVLFTSQTL